MSWDPACGFWGRLCLLTVLVLLLAIPVNRYRYASVSDSVLDTGIPAQSDWTDYGLVLRAGDLGEWDYQLWGGFACAAVKKEGVYFLYYQGASGYRIADDTVTWRSIGVATSPDGINFVKHDGNPVVTWFPSDNGEEGAVSTGVTVADSLPTAGSSDTASAGEIVLYYGANSASGATQVNADGRLATSSDGLAFTDLGVVLDHNDPSLWGSGDELFPIISFQDAGQWFVYYIPNGTPESRELGVAWGDGRDRLSRSAATRGRFRRTLSDQAVSAWGAGGYGRVGPGTYALFLNDTSLSRLEVRTVSTGAPSVLSEPIETYAFGDGIRQAIVFLDDETRTWFMYYRNADPAGYGVKLAPAGAPDASPPTAPVNVAAAPVSDRHVELAWSPASDDETGVAAYRVFRDGTESALVKGWSYRDAGLAERTRYSYQVSAVNYHGVEGPKSAPIEVTTSADTRSPQVECVSAGGDANRVSIVFDEPVEHSSAEAIANYAIAGSTSRAGGGNTGRVAVVDAALQSDIRTVILTTTSHWNETVYRISIRGVLDRAAVPNEVGAGTGGQYLYSDAVGLVGAWTFDEGQGTTAVDTAGCGNHGALIYSDRPGPVWTEGRAGQALLFDGLDDQVEVAGSGSLGEVSAASHTYAAWVYPLAVPPNTSANNAYFSVLVRDHAGLYYSHRGDFQAQLRAGENVKTVLASQRHQPAAWHHLAMVVDDASKRVHLFVDGQEVGESPIAYSGSLPVLGDQPYYVGTSDPLTERYEYRFHGAIDEVRIYDRALSPAQIQALFWGSRGRPTLETYLPLLWNWH